MPTTELEAAASVVESHRPWRRSWECARCGMDPSTPPPAPAADGALYCPRCVDAVRPLLAPAPTPRPALRFAEERRAPELPAPPAQPKEDTPVPTEGMKYKRRPCGCAPFGKHLSACPSYGSLRRATPLTPEMARPPAAVEVAQTTLRVRAPRALADAIRALLATGLHGSTEDECAERMLARGVEWTMNQRGGRS